MWAADLDALTDTHRIIVPTRRGYPGSPEAVGDWSVHTEDMVGVLDACGIESATILAHSAGSIVALDLALRHPDRVQRLVLLDPAVRLRSFLTAAFALAFARAQLVRRLRGERRGLDSWQRYILSYRTGGSAWERMPETRREAMRANAHGVFADIAAGDGSQHIDNDRLAALELPVTVILAGLSPTTLRRSGEHLARTIPDARRILIHDAGHALTVDQPAKLITLVRSALA